jgi:hypothetical protein
LATNAKRADVLAAAEDLRRRTLAHSTGPLDRLIYLSSMRDYNTGLYVHEGLAARFSSEAACEALADCHREAFRELLSLPLKDLVSQVDFYIKATRTQTSDFLKTWRDLAPYRVAIPVGTEPLPAEYLFSNLKLALAILEQQTARPVPTPAA